MNTFKPFFVHFNRNVTKHDHGVFKRNPRGFTAFVSPAADREINFRIVFCSTKDQFCKRTGRDECLAKEPVRINPRKLDYFLNQARMECGWWSTNYDYLYKYMV